MVSLQDSSIISNSSSSSKWFMGRSMRTIRSNLYQSQPSAAAAAAAVYHSENLTDSVIDLRLCELSAAATSDSPNSPIEDHHSFLLLDLDLDLSQAFSACSSSDISGELRRLASDNNNHHSAEQQPPPLEAGDYSEPCPGFLDRESFSTEIMESISPEDLQPTVKLCVDSLVSPSTAVKRSAAAKLRLLAKNRADNRALIGESGAVPALIQLLLRSTDPRTQEHAVTALLNLSLHDGNKDLMSTDPVAIKALINVLKTGTETSKQNAACALLNVSLVDEGSRMTIGACGAIPPLVSLLINGTTRGKKDALTTLYKLCGAKVNKERAVSAGAVGPLVGMVTQQDDEDDSGMAEKAMVVLSSLAGIGEGREAIVEEGGIAGLVEAIEDSSQKGKEFAVMTLLQLCADSVRNRALLVREGAIPPLAALSQSGTLKAKHKAETLLRYLREPRQEASTSTSP